ncbi:hypothetical protein TCAL_12631 [Tigriopus californicus]|uniref:Moesin/ezrin/radixin homolog 1 n=1 Tax=Tigriopus californicus TaxID=6832 RepID=A0A553P054_TIGCA|nr:moesin/ezrin/radixin homolog 1-like [Tigriopus californicus]TRY71069.1 hypothetical protein TCAL_12631 [Tigriopus californicus]|eukprot:TCALIF_12631-PA protein Name:"Similar to Moe Moesin/ezrin/radixin homolog 1 (Culex quinquefasciatus)" AED:0.07 eAED:0.07 QI:148/1/1/1/1/1/9/104/569
MSANSSVNRCVVSTFETEYKMVYDPKCYARDLFSTVISTTGIREQWYFGLSFTNNQGEEDWLILDKKINKHDISLKGDVKFKFKFKYFPENVVEDIIQNVTLRLLFYQVKNSILSESVYCPAEKAILLASFAVQAKYDDFDAEKHPPGYLANERILCQKIIDQHDRSKRDWEDVVSEFHKKNRGMFADEAMIEYLKVAQDLEMFGLSYFEVIVKNDKKLSLGIDALGINIYDLDKKLSPKLSFPWSEIRVVSKKRKQFRISFVDRKKSTFKAKPVNPKMTATIYYLATGNHDLFVQRRKGDTIEIKQMKEQKAIEMKIRERELQAFKREKQLRQRVEEAQKNLEKQYKDLEEQMAERNKELEKASESIRRLEEQLREAQTMKDDLQKQQQELKDMLEKMEKDREMDAEEKEKLQSEIKAKEEEIEAVRLKVANQEEETRKIQNEIEEAKKTIKEQVEKRIDIPVMNSDFEEKEKIPEIVVDKAIGGGNRSSSDSSDSEDEEKERKPDPKTENVLKTLREDLDKTLVEGRETEEDRQHRDNLKQGRDKYKTLRDVRMGNTKRRIDTFENM